MSESVSVGVIGASGYSGELLVRLLADHPRVELSCVASRSHAGEAVEKILPRLRGRLGDLTFTSSDPVRLVEEKVDLWFLALPHGVAAEFALPLVEAGRTVIDLSADFRLHSEKAYRFYYGMDHPVPAWLERVPYVLPELADRDWKQAPLIACPGCYPTSVLMPLVPLLRDGLIDPSGIVINSLSGVSGAGKKATEMYSFCEREGSLIAYGQTKHRHLAEIEEQLNAASSGEHAVQFTPHLVPIVRGILTTIVVPARGTIVQLYESWNRTYGQAPAVGCLNPGESPDTLNVVGRNRIEMGALYDERTRSFVINSAIDNLMKGASGQAVQIMNELKGWPALEGLS